MAKLRNQDHGIIFVGEKYGSTSEGPIKTVLVLRILDSGIHPFQDVEECLANYLLEKARGKFIFKHARRIEWIRQVKPETLFYEILITAEFDQRSLTEFYLRFQKEEILV